MEPVGSLIGTVLKLAIMGLLSILAVSLGEFGGDMVNAIISQLGYVLLIPVLLMLVCKNDIKRTIRIENGINILQIGLIVLMCISAFLPIQYANSVAVTVLSDIFGAPKELSGASEAATVPQLFLGIALLAFLPAICEELFFRGYVMRGLEKNGKPFAIVVSALMFAIMHSNFQQMIYAFVCGLFFAYLVMATDSLLSSIVAHGTFNAISVVLSYKPIKAIFDQITVPAVAVALRIFPLLFGASLVAFMYVNKGFKISLEKENISKKEKIVSVILFIVFVIVSFAQAIYIW